MPGERTDGPGVDGEGGYRWGIRICAHTAEFRIPRHQMTACVPHTCTLSILLTECSDALQTRFFLPSCFFGNFSIKRPSGSKKEKKKREGRKGLFLASWTLRPARGRSIRSGPGPTEYISHCMIDFDISA